MSPRQKRALGVRLRVEPRRIVPLRVRARPWPLLAVHQRHNQPVPLFRRISHLLYSKSFNRSRKPASVYMPAKDRCKVGRRTEASSYPARLLPPPLYSPSKSLGEQGQIDASRQPPHNSNVQTNAAHTSNRRLQPPNNTTTNLQKPPSQQSPPNPRENDSLSVKQGSPTPLQHTPVSRTLPQTSSKHETNRKTTAALVFSSKSLRSRK